MRYLRHVLPVVIMLLAVTNSGAFDAPAGKSANPACVDCHAKVTPGAVADWKVSKHASQGITCEACHGSDHSSAADAAKALVADAETCAQCHEQRAQQFDKGVHGQAWKSMAAVFPLLPPSTPRVLLEGMKGCGGCHKLFGLKKSPEEKATLRAHQSEQQSGSCDACHTRHTFSALEARQPQACQTCHQGEEHLTYALWDGSKHGVRAKLIQIGKLPKGAVAPTCQTCHMPGGDHEVFTAWGWNALRLPVEEKGDPQWTADRTTIMQGLGVLDIEGKPTPLLDGAIVAKHLRPTRDAWQQGRDKMVLACTQCHSERFARAELGKGDQLVREADHIMADAIRVVSALYKDGVVEVPGYCPTPIGHIITFPEMNPNPAEALLRELYFDHRSKTWMSAFHNNPGFPYWSGYNRMQTVLYEIKEKAAELRREKAAEGVKPTTEPTR